jgi:hypothetical protein
MPRRALELLDYIDALFAGIEDAHDASFHRLCAGVR